VPVAVYDCKMLFNGYLDWWLHLVDNDWHQYVYEKVALLKSGYERSTLQQTIAFILSNTCCSTSVHWNGTSLDVRRVSGARISDLLGHMSR
jgi:hypothetical protein